MGRDPNEYPCSQLRRDVKYPVTSIFRSLQGEGHFVGYQMTFVRLAGCSVGKCSIRKECDEAPWKATARSSAAELVEQCRLLASDGIVCITGGEPTDHDLVPLIASLRDGGFRVHLETSGVRSVAGAPLDWLTVSPKTPDYVQREGHTLKVVVRPGMTWAEIAAIDVGTTFFHRYLQPLTQDDGGTNLHEVIRLLFDNNFGGTGRWALSVQAHKEWGMNEPGPRREFPAAAVVKSLGIDVPAWAGEIRAKVVAAQSAPQPSGTRGEAPSGPSAEMVEYERQRVDRLARSYAREAMTDDELAADEPAPAPQPEAPAGCVKCRNGIDRQGRACRYCSWKAEPLPAEPPSDAGQVETEGPGWFIRGTHRYVSDGGSSMHNCAHDCGASMWNYGSSAPDGIDAHGVCPKAPKPPAERPAPEVAIDWSRFVPTEEIESHGDSSYLQIQTGTVYASWTIEGGSVWRAGEAWLAGRKDGSGSRWRIIRHANGRWAEGYGPDGPIAPTPSEPAKAPLSERLRSYSSAATLPHWRAEIEGLAREAADLEARPAFVTSGLESATNGERLERLRVDDLTARLAAAEKERDGLTLALDAANAVAESNIKAKLAAEKTADARVAEERARCLDACRRPTHAITGQGVMPTLREVAERIASGAPAPTVPELPSGCSACGTRFGAFAEAQSHRCPEPAPTVKP